MFRFMRAILGWIAPTRHWYYPQCDSQNHLPKAASGARVSHLGRCSSYVETTIGTDWFAEYAWTKAGSAQKSPMTRNSMNHSGREITVSAWLRLYIGQMQRSLDAALDALARSVTPVNVHASRTQMRRVRVFLRTFRLAFNPAQLARYENALRRLTRELSAVRSADVERQIIERLAEDQCIPREDGLQELRAIAANARSRAVWDLQAKINENAWLRRVERLRQSASDPKLIVESQVPMAVMAALVIRRRRRRLQRRLLAHKRSPKALHKRRLKIKALRYLLERCAPNNAAVRAELKQLRLLQDDLGEFHDEWALRRRLARQRRYLRATIDIRSRLLGHREQLLHSIEKHQQHLLRIWKDRELDRLWNPRTAAVA
jgi:CHAD domain-containing protein